MNQLLEMVNKKKTQSQTKLLMQSADDQCMYSTDWALKSQTAVMGQRQCAMSQFGLLILNLAGR